MRSLGFQPEPSSHDWHVQPSCQRTDPLPPERALSVQSRDTQVRPCLSAKLVQTTRLRRSLSTRCWHRISTCFPQSGELNHSLKRSSSRTRRNASPTYTTTPMPFRHKPRRKSINLKKDHLEVSAKNAFNPSRNLVPECSPVAGTDLQELTCSCLMPDERREFHKIRPTSHTLLSVDCLYQMNAEKRKGEIWSVTDVAR